MTKQECIGTSYQPIGGGYAYSALRVGLVVRNPAGQEIYCQAGVVERLTVNQIAAGSIPAREANLHRMLYVFRDTHRSRDVHVAHCAAVHG